MAQAVQIQAAVVLPAAAVALTEADALAVQAVAQGAAVQAVAQRAAVAQAAATDDEQVLPLAAALAGAAGQRHTVVDTGAAERGELHALHALRRAQY